MKFLFSVTFITLSVFGFSQSKITLTATVMDEEIPSCNNVLSKNIQFQYKYEEGYRNVQEFTSVQCPVVFSLSRVPGNFRMIISSPDHTSQTLDFEITGQSPDTLQLGEIYLSRKQDAIIGSSKEKELQGVTVTGIKEKFITVEANKTSYSVKNNDILSGGSTEDALKKLPGVVKGFGGELTVNGKSMAIYIDNSPTGLSGDDLENLLQSIPASSIEKIEIINNPGASYEANTSGGIINIVTNGKALRGINGTATMNYRFNRNNKVSPSVSLNTRINKVSLQLNSGFNYKEWDRVSDYNREFTYFSPSVKINQNTDIEGYNRFYFFRPSANIKFNEKSNLLLNYNFAYTLNDTYSTSRSLSTSGTSPIDLLNNTKSTNDNTNHEIIAKYRMELDTLGRNFDVTAYYSRFNKSTLSKYSQNNLGIQRYSLSDIDSRFDNFYTKANLEIPFKKIDLSLNLGGKYSISSASSLGKYNLLNYSPDILNSPEYLSFLDFDYDEHQYAFYTEFTKKISKLSLTAGLRYENLQYKSFVKQDDKRVKNNLDQLYPSFGLLYKLSPIVNLNASYRKSISLPSYTNLDPNISGYFDEYNTSTGNLYLQPDYYDNYEVSVSAFNYLRLSFQYTYSKQLNMMSFETEDNSLVVNQTTKTYKGMNNYNVSLGIPVPFGLVTQGSKFFKEPMNVDKMSFIYFYGMYNYFKLDDYPYTEKVKPLWFYAFYSQIVLPKDFKLTAFYMFSTDNGYFRVYKAKKPFNYSNLELSRSFYDKAFKVSFGIDNLFNSNKISAQIASQNLNTNFYQRDDYRTYYFKLSYNFGKLRNMRKENTSIENEKTDKDPINAVAPPLK